MRGNDFKWHFSDNRPRKKSEVRIFSSPKWRRECMKIVPAYLVLEHNMMDFYDFFGYFQIFSWNFMFNRVHTGKTDSALHFTFTLSFQILVLLWYLLIAIGAFPFSLVIFCAVIVCWIIKCSITSSDRSSSSLIIEMPIKTYKRFMLIAFVLQKV